MQRIIRIGKSIEILENLLLDDVFVNLSKHAVQWQSEHEREADIICTARMKFSRIQDTISMVINLLNNGYDDE